MAIHPPLRRNFLFSPPTPLHFVSEYGTIIKPLPRCPTQNSTRSGRLAQLVEHLLDVQEVTGSSPVPSTKIKTRGRRPRVLFCTGIAEAAPVRVLYCCAAEPRAKDGRNCIGQQKGRASSEGVSAFLFSAAGAVQADLEKFRIFSLSAPARFDWRFSAAPLFIDPAFPARAGGQPGRSPGRRRHGCPVRSDGRRHRRCGCWRRHPGCRA